MCVYGLRNPLPFRSLYVNMVGLWVTVSLAMLSGLTMYSIYKKCDPLLNGDINTTDQVTAAATAWMSCWALCDQVWLTVKMLHIYEQAAALPGDGHSGTIPWNPWSVCGCCIQWDTQVRQKSTSQECSKNCRYCQCRVNFSVIRD